MDIAALNTSLRAAITAYAPINTWAQATYGKDALFIDDLEERDVPDEESCPYMAIEPTGRETGEETRTAYSVFEALLCVNDATANGFANLEAFRGYFEDAITGDIAGSTTNLSNMDAQYDKTGSFPLLYCYMKLRFKDPMTIGRNPMK